MFFMHGNEKKSQKHSIKNVDGITLNPPGQLHFVQCRTLITGALTVT